MSTTRQPIALCLLFAAAACAPPAAAPATTYRLSGRIDGLADGTAVTLQKAGAYVGFTFEDVAVANSEGGRFVFEGSLPAPEMHYLQVEGVPRKIRVFLENGDVTVTTDPSGEMPAEVDGSASHRLWSELRDGLALHDDQVAAIEDALDRAREAAAGEVRLAELEGERKSAAAARRSFIGDFVARHADSTVAAYAVVAHLANAMDYDELAPVVEGFDRGLHGTRYLADLGARMDGLAAVQVGREAPDFASLDLAREPIHLADFRGRWVLVDFWGSWCGPCRAQNPQLVALYDRYRSRGFEILGVALEFGGEEPWRQAIAVDGLTWSQASELSGFVEEAARAYAVRALPANVLIDPHGVIAGRNLRDEALEERLAELLGSAG